MKKLAYVFMAAVTALLVLNVAPLQAQTLVNQWGSTSQGRNWPILNDANTPAGNAGMAGTNPIPGNGWATIRGEFDALQATTSQAVVVTGKIQFVGATGGGSTYTPLRYALTYHQNDTLNNALTSTAAWVRGPGSGYTFCPRSGAGTVANGAWGSGTVGVLRNGNWNSTNSNGGPALATILQAPRNAELVQGTYDFAFSVLAINDTTNEIRWYLVEQSNKYWFGGTVTGPASTTQFNGVCFGVNTGGWTQVNLTGVKAELGAPISVPEAPWQSYYVDLWGTSPQGRYWKITNDASTLVGDASIVGTAPINGAGQATVRGGFGQDLQIKTDEALIVSGELELIGTKGGESSYNPLRFALTYHANDTLRYALTDSARWVRGPGYGYNWCPRTGAGTVANGAWGSGTVGIVNNGNWNSTNSNGGPALATILQAPRNAQMIPGTYKWAISVQAVNDTTNEVRWYLIEQATKYWFGGTVTARASTQKVNAINFGLNTGDWTKFNILAAQVDYGAPITVPEAPFEAYYIDLWGTSPQGRYWKIKNDASTLTGDATIESTAPINGAGQATVRGGFGQDLQIKTDKALIVSGELELVGTKGGESSYNPLRFALTYHANDTLRYALTDTARWVRGPGYGYNWCPRTGAGTVANGAWGSGTVGIVNNGNWNSTNSNGGPALATILQAPRNAQMIPGTYKWVISVQAVNDTTNEIRWYLIEQATKYWFGGTVTTRASTQKINAINFGLNTGDWTKFNILAAQVDYGAPITVPEAPFEAYYLDQWGRTTEGFGNAWPHGMLNDANTPVGNASIAGVQPMPATTNGASLRGGFGQDITIPSDKALVVKGQLEYVGGGMGSVYTPLRYAITYLDSLTLRYQNTDSAQWGSTRGNGSQNHHYGYEFTPRSSTGTQPNGSGGSGSVWGIVNGNWASTFSNGGGIIGPVVNQAPRNAEISVGTYIWAISVQSINDTTNEVRWSLVKTDNKYWFGGSVRARAITQKLNGVAFWFKDGAVTQFNIFDAQIDFGDPIVVPPAPFEAYYAENFGVIGNRFGGWKFTPGAVSGNATISGNAPNTGLAALRVGLFEPITPSKDKALVITGQVEFVGGGFQAANSLRFGVFYSDSAGTLISTPVDSTRWSGTERAHSGYLFLPQSGSNGPANWQGIGKQGSYGAVVNGTWWSTDGASNYVLGADLHHPANALGGAGTYDFAISVAPQGNGTSEVRFKLIKKDNSYSFYGKAIDNHSPLVTNKFNCVAFALNTGNTTTTMNLIDVYVDLGAPIDIPTSVQEGTKVEIPTEYVLDQNYPNPFNPTTTIEFGLPRNGEVKLMVFDLSGRIVAEVVTGNLNAGYHSINFDASNLASGIYYYQLKAGDFVSVKKFTLLK